MGSAKRTTILLLDLSDKATGGTNVAKRAALEHTTAILNAARAFFLEFLLLHHHKFNERITYFSEKHQEKRERKINSNELRSWLEQSMVPTADHPNVPDAWDFKARFPAMPIHARRSAMKDAIGKAKAYLTALESWKEAGKAKGKPGLPGEADFPTFYAGSYELELDSPQIKDRFVRLKVYDGQKWDWVNFPVRTSRHFERRMVDPNWQAQSPTLVLRKRTAALHFPASKEVEAARVVDRKQDPHVVTIGIDLNVHNLAVVTVRRDGESIETVFLTDHGLDQARYRHLKRIAKKQWLSGKPVKGEHSNQDLWQHVRHMNEDAARTVACAIASICARYPGCLLLFERLRKIKPSGGSKSRRMNRRQSNQLRGKIRQYAGEYAYARSATVTVEVNPHGTSTHCPRCGNAGKRFFRRNGTREFVKWGNLFWCPACGYEANADFCASVNVHHSFWREFHWQPRPKPPPKTQEAPSG